MESMQTWQAMTPHSAAFFEAAAAHPERALLALDFDGTLAAIVPDPEDSRLHEASSAALGRLCGVLGAVAIITGRAVGTVRRLARLDERPELASLIVLGAYGAERYSPAEADGPARETPEGIAAARPELEALIAEFGVAGVGLEDKGAALGVHTRRAADPTAAFEALRPGVGEIAARHGLVLEPGRNVLEVRASAVTKGEAIRSLVEETSATVVAMCGDDLGDLPAFAELTALREDGSVTCRVVSGSDEQDVLVAHADVLTDGPDGMADWLTALADRVVGPR